MQVQGGLISMETLRESRERLVKLLRELFQFDLADLDFGIYRILNFRRQEIEHFIDKDLIDKVEQKLFDFSNTAGALLKDELKAMALEINKDFGEGTIDNAGEAKKQQAAPKVQEYLRKREELLNQERQRLAVDDIYNHLYEFFSRYFDKGDFLSTRRVSGKEKYVVPYRGEEVLLHWANRDQYYVKTDEYFTNYTFKVGGWEVFFQIAEADPEQGTAKGEKRFFILANGKEPELDKENRELRVYFHYRPLTKAEQSAYGERVTQDAIAQRCVAGILQPLQGTDLGRRLSEKPGDEGVSILQKHVERYVKRNTMDYFIHRDLKGFLKGELDFYVETEVLNLADMERLEPGAIRREMARVRTIREVSETIIEFLAQIEEFQKRLFEKRKFVIQTQYCVTMRNIPESFYEEIAGNVAQWTEWKETFHINEEQGNLFSTTARSREGRRIAFLRAHPTLVLDTKHFDADFVDRLLASFEDLDDMTDGLLIHSENFQALNLLEEKYRETVRAVYIDPPYNTFATKILYKNEYEHSSWLTLLENRLSQAHRLLAKDAITCTMIDDYELHRLVFVMERIFGADNHLATVAIRNNPSGRSTVKGFAINHEYGLFFCRSSENAVVGRMPHTEAQTARYDEKDAAGKSFEWENFRKSSAGSYRPDRPRQYFPLYYNEQTRSLRIPKLDWHDATRAWRVLESARKAETAIWPKDGAGRERVWRYGIERTLEALREARVEKTQNGFEVYTRKYLQTRGSLPRTWWDKAEYSARDNGTRALADLFGSEKPFDFPKAPAAVMDSIRVCCPGEGGIVLDYFAGSGTTGHAIVNLNREEDEGIRFILVEVTDSFDTVLLPRIKKVTFSPEWKDGKAARQATEEEADRSPRVVKVVRLESYEDTLDNIVFRARDKTVQGTLDEFTDYFVRYMLDYETRGSPVRLSVSDFETPFDYKIWTERGGERMQTTVDLVETFSYLLGLHVMRLRTAKDNGRLYKAVFGRTGDGTKVVAVWRSIKGIDYGRDRDFIEKTFLKDAEKPFVLFVNGLCHVKESRPIEPEFRRLMGA